MLWAKSHDQGTDLVAESMYYLYPHQYSHTMRYCASCIIFRISMERVLESLYILLTTCLCILCYGLCIGYRIWCHNDIIGMDCSRIQWKLK